MKEKSTLVFATNNAHKLSELRQMAGDGLNILSLADIGCDDDIPETGQTLEENSLIKAKWIKERYGYDCFADDTGLEVYSLGGEPGVRSARYASDGHDSAANMALLLKKLEGESDRRARFRTVVTLIEGERTTVFTGEVKGVITCEAAGCGGFGYDPVFKPEGWTKTFAEASAEEKNAISHRGRAVAQLIEYLNKSRFDNKC
ncbi:MAG: non-canonical purine NTP diphosphatase [Muribaculaceae bacterium]|nr:non-canonical purine NTP diphosphatase [Muribaculaceae bacterium]MDE6332660.1 non-canonical purine NTP diphosphatase [Muribaculaceae bacterium]